MLSADQVRPLREALAGLVADHGDTLPLDRGVALVAAEERPGLAPEAPVEALDRLAGRVGRRPGASPFVQVANLNHHLFTEEGFQGDNETYDDPDNSLLDSVLERKKGLPILLSVVYTELGRRLGFEVDGVGFPGHFVVSPRKAEPRFFVDPFHGGTVLKECDLRAMLKRFSGAWNVEPETWKRFVAPVSNRATLQRINNNLKRTWVRRKNPEAALRAADRNLVLEPDSVSDQHDRAVLLARLGRFDAAVVTVERALETDLDPSQREFLRVLLEKLHAAR
jgi:regulator of sirC expression with transglutaminase-like and TPR domain